MATAVADCEAGLPCACTDPVEAPDQNTAATDTRHEAVPAATARFVSAPGRPANAVRQVTVRRLPGLTAPLLCKSVRDSVMP